MQSDHAVCKALAAAGCVDVRSTVVVVVVTGGPRLRPPPTQHTTARRFLVQSVFIYGPNGAAGGRNKEHQQP